MLRKAVLKAEREYLPEWRNGIHPASGDPPGMRGFYAIAGPDVNQSRDDGLHSRPVPLWN